MARKPSSSDMEKSLSLLTSSRTGKKGSITKRIKRIEELVDQGGSRRVIRSLVTALGNVFEKLMDVCAQTSASRNFVQMLKSAWQLQRQLHFNHVGSRTRMFCWSSK